MKKKSSKCIEKAIHNLFDLESNVTSLALEQPWQAHGVKVT